MSPRLQIPSIGHCSSLAASAVHLSREPQSLWSSARKFVVLLQSIFKAPLLLSLFAGFLCHSSRRAEAQHLKSCHLLPCADPQISAASISCSSVRVFMLVDLLCKSAFKRAVITRIFTSANFLTLETAVIPATVIAVKMCAHQDSGFLFIHRPPPPFLHSSKLYTVPDSLRKRRGTGNSRRSSWRGTSLAHLLYPALRTETSQKSLAHRFYAGALCSIYVKFQSHIQYPFAKALKPLFYKTHTKDIYRLC